METCFHSPSYRVVELRGAAPDSLGLSVRQDKDNPAAPQGFPLLEQVANDRLLPAGIHQKNSFFKSVKSIPETIFLFANNLLKFL